jgi:CRISPR-associated protein (TIGR03986 family)
MSDSNLVARWKIAGVWTLKSNMHLGNGFDELDDREREPGDNDDRFYSTVAKDYNEQPYIPGSSIKGALRNFANQRMQDPAAFKRIFGCALNDEKKQSETVAGQTEFYSAYSIGQAEISKVSRTAIDRCLQTVVDKKLFVNETVVAGTRFSVEIVCQNLNTTDIDLLVSLLEQTNVDSSFSLGAGKSNSAGRVDWKLTKVLKFGSAEFSKWITDNTETDIWNFASDETLSRKGIALSEPSEAISLDVKIDFSSAFLVNEPWSGNKPDGEPDAKPRKMKDGRLLLPSTSIKGALRAQAEKILRTIGDETEQGHRVPAFIAGTIHTDLASVLFGATGWQAVLRISDFISASKVDLKIQHNVAIDRFTGGGLDGAKFSTQLAESPSLCGVISIDLRRLKLARAKLNKTEVTAFDSGIGLLLLTLRDFDEGDVQLGYGKSKGYGICTANALVQLRSALAANSIGTDETAAIEAFRTAFIKLDEAPLKTAQKTVGAPTKFHHFNPAPEAVTGDFHLPYTFLPIDNCNGVKDWQIKDGLARSSHSHDRYQANTYCGKLIVEIETMTPTVIGADRQEHDGQVKVKPFEYQGKPAIPGTSIRGMLSSLHESISGSGFRVLGNEMLSVRQSVGERSGPGGSSSALGLLVQYEGDDSWKLEPLALGTIKLSNDRYSLSPAERAAFEADPVYLKVLFDSNSVNSSFEKAIRSNSTENLNGFWWMKLEVVELCDPEGFSYFKVGGKGLRIPSGTNDNPLKNKDFLIGQTPKPNSVVPILFEELPVGAERADYTRGFVRIMRKVDTRKHHVFVPYPEPKDDKDCNQEPIVVPPSVIQRFVELSNERFRTQKKKIQANELKDKLDLLPFVPIQSPRSLKAAYEPRINDIVFFKLNDAGNEVTEISYSSIWRSRVEDSKNNAKRIHNFVKNWSPELLPFANDDRLKLSPTELLFGVVAKNTLKEDTSQSSFAFKGKVAISNAYLSSSEQNRLDENVTLRILSSPKLPAPSMYFTTTEGSNNHYLTKSSFLEQAAKVNTQVTMRGRKTYLHALRRAGEVVGLDSLGKDAGGNRTAPWKTLDKELNKEQKVTVTPIKIGTRFIFEIKFDNLAIDELQNLCAVITPSEKFEHKIGMGKPIGLGSIKLRPVRLLLVDRIRRYLIDSINIARYASAWSDVFDQTQGSDVPPLIHAELREIATHSAESPVSLAAKKMNEFKNTSPDLWTTLNLCGDPSFVKKPVIYPVFDGPAIGKEQKNENRESDGFIWFVANERKSRETQPGSLGSLKVLDRNSNTLPTLKRVRN